MHAASELRAVLDAADRLEDTDTAYATATVVKVEGSTYRLPGARQLVAADGSGAGSVSGGCLDSEVRQKALEVIDSRLPEVTVYDLTEDDPLWGWGAGCNGITTVLFEPRDHVRPALDALRRSLDGAQLAFATSIGDTSIGDTGMGRRIIESGTASGSLGNDDLDAIVDQLAHEAITDRHHDHVEVTSPDGEITEVFIEYVAPPPRLLVCGAGNDVVPIVKQASDLGFEVLVAEDRPGLLTADRFPGVTAFIAGPQAAAEAAGTGRQTFAVLMSHNFMRDGDYLAALCGTAVTYIGALGPKERSQKLLDYVRTQGVDPSDADIAKLHGPAGLDLGAEGPQEIAWAIMAEILAVKNERHGGYLRDRSRPIHEKHE